MAQPFFASTDNYVDQALQGFARSNRDVVALHIDPTFVRAVAPDPRRRVGIVSGGGSGHEPMHTGLVGRGMLDAAAPGRVFASPHNRQVYQASRAVAGPDGVLHIVKNYTGDRINFGIAAERLRHDGIDVDRVLVDDDIATDNEHTATGRRGTGATIVIEKLVGAAADRGVPRAELAELGGRIAARSRSVAVAARAHTSPATGQAAFDLPPGRLEYGVGIHCERAGQSIDRPPVEDLVARMLADVLAKLPSGDRVLLVVNGLGATTAIELHNVFTIAETTLAARGITLGGSLVGTWTPALDMKGFSLTLTMIGKGWQRLWDAPAWTAALRK
jgi:phosphoenolpyruvate---glycerone phosphotransferase subunit DhaK